MNQGRSRWNKFALGAMALLAATALMAAACSSGTSSKDKTATAGAKTGTTAVASKSAATVAATKAATTPAAGVTTVATAGASAGGVKVADSALGKILVDAKGFSVYTFKNDVAGNGKSAGEALAAVWPPLSLPAAPSGIAGATGEWGVITRVDGKTQVTYKGLPLYFFANDKAAGDTKGDKVGNVWFIAVP